MASSRIKGIKIEIDGDTTKLGNALGKLNAPINRVNDELKEINKALKLDPKNTELLAQKQDVLKSNIEASRKKLSELQNLQSKMGDYSKLTDDQKEAYRALGTEIAQSESAIRKLNSQLSSSAKLSNTFDNLKSGADKLKKLDVNTELHKMKDNLTNIKKEDVGKFLKNSFDKVDLSKLNGALKKVGNIAAEVVKKVGQVVAGVSTAMAGVITAGVNSYADLEQNIGGVETLFGDSADKVIENAKKAYETAGVSANEYMQGVTSFSASLLQSLGGDTSKAADVADMAFRDMSDNANKFGTDMSSIQNAYQGFAKQNYTMLDNLKLGYGGTKSEMERLLADAEKFSGVHYDINNLSDVYNAIHVIQDELKVTGTTSKEAATTISGSAKAMKSSFNNFLNGTGSPEQLSGSIGTFLDNVSKAVIELAPKLLEGIVQVVNNLLPKVSEILNATLPLLFEMAQKLLTSLLTMVQQNIQPIVNMAIHLLTSLANFILENLPLIIKTGLELVVALAKGISENLPKLIPTIVDVILEIVNVLLDNLDLLIEASIQIIVALTGGIMNALPSLLARIPEIIIKICSALINFLPQVLSAGLRITTEIGLGIIRGIPSLISKIPQLISSIINSLKQSLFKFLDIGKNMVQGIWSGISGSFTWIKNKISGWVGNVLGFIKKLFGIHSPSRVMRDQIGVNLTKGIGKGFEKGMPDTLKEVNRAMSELNTGIQTSVNPVINPTANSNPLILNIDKFVNSRDTDIQQLAEEIEFYRKNNALAKGDN